LKGDEKMGRKNKILRKFIATLLLNVFSFNILAGGLQVDPNSRYNTSLDRSQNGIPVVNISTPNGRGVSINEFLEYNVGREGQVLNNADNIGRSHLAGIINANPNLGPNQAANLILLQVNGANRSQIEGYIEALSRQKVNVILSNENGIYLNGAGTINIRNFIPTTGRVKLKDGDVIGIDVEKGRVVIGADGFDATNTDYVNVIAKAMELQGNLVGNRVDVTLGENTVDSGGAVTSKNGINSVAIDASNLGSMYAGQIKIVSTDKGAGVNSNGLIYSRDTKLEITADGKINVAKIKGNGIEISGTEYAQTELASSDRGININAAKIKMAGETQANNDVNLNGNVENKSNIYTGGNLNTLDMVNSGNISASGNITAKGFKNLRATVLSGGNFNVKNLDNSGNIQVSGITDINGKFDNTGALASVKRISVSGNVGSTGKIQTNEALNINGLLDNSGTVEAAKNISVAGNVLNSGKILTDGDLTSKNTDTSGTIVSNSLKTGNLKNDGKIIANKDLTAEKVASAGDITVVGKISAGRLKSSGTLRTNEDLSVNGKFENDGTVETSKNVAVSGDIKNNGKVAAGGNIRAKKIRNTGDIAAAGRVSSDDMATSGTVKSNKKITVAGKLENDGTMETAEDIEVSGNIRNTGRITSNGDLTGRDTATSGKIVSKNVKVDNLNNDGVIVANGSLNAKNVKNTKDITAVGTVSANDLATSGKVRANGKITVAGKLENRGAVETSKNISVAGNIKNDGRIAANEDLTGKHTENNGNIYVKNLEVNNLKNTGKIEGVNLKTDDIANSGDITAIGKISGGNIDNSGKLLANDTIDAKNIKNAASSSKIAAGKGITGERIDNSGTFATNGDIKATSSLVNSGTVDGKGIDVAGADFVNSGKINADNIRARVVNTRNDGYIYSGNDVDLTTNTLINTKEITAVNNVNAANANVTNNGKIASNGRVLLDNSAITNTGEILSGEIFMRNAQKFDNIGTIKGNNTELSINQDINLAGNLHGQQRLKISGNNITNNGNTTGTGLIEINSNDFTNNRELASSTVIVNGRGEVVNNSIITGNDGKVSGKNITNNDLIAFDNYLEMNAQGKVQNNKGKAIYGGQTLIVKANEIMNDEAEILGGNMDLNAAKITNNVATIQSNGDITITSSDFQNIGRVSNLGSYEKYYEAWDGTKISEGEIASRWIDLDTDGETVTKNKHRRWSNFKRKYIDKLKGRQATLGNKIPSFLLTLNTETLKREAKDFENIETGSTLHPEIPLKGKIKSNAVTEYGKILAAGNITVNSGNFKNKDSIISGGGLVNINATNFENSVTLGNAVQLKNGKEKISYDYDKKKHGMQWKLHAKYERTLIDGDIGYESGQPSIIEGSAVNINAPNIIRNPIEAGNGLRLNNGGATGRTLLSSTSIGVNKGINSTNGTVHTAGNTLLSKINSSFSGNTQVNGSTNLNNPVNNGFDRAIQIAGNNSGIKDIKNTGRIDVNPILASAMFTANMNPSSRYLMETRSRYINLGQYFGSDYFTSRVGYSEIWDRTRRLGDAYYENQLLTRALAEKLGTAFINGKSNQELIKSMMDNAAAEGTRLGLTVGQELTQEQINNLNEDIVWYVTKQVNGIEVLTPQVYLSKNTRSIINDDTRNRVGGISGTYVKTNDFVNDGTRWGNGGITYVEANTVRNETTNNLLSEITGDRTFIQSAGNIENIGGRISGNEAVALVSDNGKVVNDTTKGTAGYYNGEFDRTRHEEVKSLGTISSNGTVLVKAGSYESTGGMLSADHLALDVNKVSLNALSLSGEDKFGSGGSSFSRYSETTHLGAGISADSAQGTVGDMNLKGSSFIAKDTTGLTIGNVKAESAVNSYDTESRQSSRSTFSSGNSYRKSHTEENSASNLMLGKNAVITGNVEGIGSNIVLGENTSVGGKVTTDSRQLHSNYYEENKKKGFSGGISHGTASLNYGKSQSTYDEKSTVNAKSNLQIGDGSVLNRGAEITSTNFEYGNIQINNGDVKYGTRIDTRDVKTTSRSSNFGVSVGINSPIKDRIKQAAGAVSQVKNGDTAGGAMEAINAAAGTINGLALNQGSRQASYDSTGSVGKEGAKNAMANSNFYANIGVNAGFTRSKSSSSSHTEGAAVTTLKPMNENSSITYNNVNSITYQGTQAQGGTFIYNNVANIQKEAVELHNSYSSSSSSRGINAGATIGYGHKIQTTGNGGSISSSRSNQNTVETIYANGNFKNVNEVHNNTGSMVLNGFNQEGGKVTGNIGKVEVISRQNTSTTTGSSRGMNFGISANGVPSSVNISGSRTNGNRAFVDNQSSFIVGEGSNLHVGTLENTGAAIGKQSDNGTTFKIDNYIGKNLYNEDTMTTTGGTIGASVRKNPKITNIGVNRDSRSKEGITRNTIVGNVEIQNASGDEINRDLSKANEITKDTHRSTNINVEPQVIEYISNPAKFKEDLEVAILEGKATGETVLKSIENAVNGRKSSDIGDPERRTINEIKESVIRVKTAPEMNLIATGDLNSEKILKELDISAVEKYDPDNPNLPPKVRARVDKLAQKGEVPGIFYDKITNKIFVDENITDEAVIRAGIAREWKISEDLKTGKGKENDEGQLKATVAGELAYDDMMKRAREGKTGSISTSELGVAVMDVNSEVTADNVLDWLGAQYKKRKEDLGQFAAGVKKDLKKLKAETGYQIRKVGNNVIALKEQYIDKNPKKANETRQKIRADRSATTRKKKQYDAEASSYKRASEGRKRQIDKNLKAKEESDRQHKIAKNNRKKENQQAINSLKQQINKTTDPKKKKELQAQLDSVEPHPVKKFLEAGEKGIKDSLTFEAINSATGGLLGRGISRGAAIVTGSMGGLVATGFLLTSQNMGTNDETDIYSKYRKHPELIPVFNKSKDISQKEANYIREKYPQYYSDFKIADRINPNKTDFDKHKTDLKVAGTYGMKDQKESGAKILGTMAGYLGGSYLASGIRKGASKGAGAVINTFKPKNPVTRMTVASSTTEAISYTRNVERIAQTAGNAAKNLKTPVIEYKASSKPAVIEEVVTNVEEAGSKGGMKLKLNLQLFASKNNSSGGVGNGVKKSVEPPVKDSDKIYTLGRNNEWSVNNTVTSVKKMETSGLNDVYKVEINNGITPNYAIVNGQNFLTMKEYNNIATKMSDSIKPLNAIKDPVLNVETVREYLADNSYIKSKFLKENKLTVAIGKITLSDGTTENVIAVNGWDGKVWKNGKIPNTISIETMDNQIFKVIKDDNPSLKKFDNWNHAEKKIASYAQDNYSGKISKIEISVQNNSLIFPGMCEGCNKSMFDFYQKNPKTDITIYEGTTGKGK